MSNAENINNAQVNPETVKETQVERQEPTRAPSETARAIERANSTTSYSVEYWTNNFKEAEVGDAKVEIILDPDQDPEKVRPKAISYARHASFRRFENGGLTQQKAEHPTYCPEGTSEVSLDNTTELSGDSSTDKALLAGLNSRRTGRI